MSGGASAHGTGGNPVYEYIRFRGSLPSAVAEAVENVSAGSCRNHGAPPSRRQIILIARANRQAEIAAIAAAGRSWLTDSGRSMDKTGLFVPLSRVNKPAKFCSNRLPLVLWRRYP